MEITLQELNDYANEIRIQAEKAMRTQIVKYIKEGYTTNGLLFMLSKFNLMTGESRKIEIDGYDSNKPVMIINPRDEE
tara:strand:+ start:1306 stop:1539 length:234 start_codon:yes stop_codon:yes gene_type:complete